MERGTGTRETLQLQRLDMILLESADLQGSTVVGSTVFGSTAARFLASEGNFP